MKLTEYLLFLALLIPTFVVLVAAAVSLAHPDLQPATAQMPPAMASSAGLYATDEPYEEDARR